MGRIVKTFFHTFIKSLFPNPGYYSKIIRSPFPSSFKYFLTFLLVLNVSLIFFIAVKYNPNKVNLFLSSLSASLDRYPNDLIISVHKGRLITNYNRPYLLWLDKQTEKNLLLVIDETATPNKIKLYGTSALLTSREVVVSETQTGNASVFPLQYLDDQKITKQQMNSFVQLINKINAFFPILFILGLLILVILIPLASFIVTFVYLFLASIIVFFVFKLFLQKHFHFRRIFQISLHAVTFPLLLDYSFMMVRPTINNGPSFLMAIKQIPFPMLFLIILAVFVAVGVYEAHGDGKAKLTPHHKKR